MADYVIGDIQGCYQPLMRLLEKIHFEPHRDRLWFVGDLVNRGPDSLAVLRFVKSLPIQPVVVLGNHDLYLLSRLFVQGKQVNHDDTIDDVLNAEDALILGHWLREQVLLYHAPEFDVIICHAGIAPVWSLHEAKLHAQEVETVLRSAHFIELLRHLFGDYPLAWSDTLFGVDRLRCIINFFTRMRFCDAQGGLDLSYKGEIAKVPRQLIPWYAHPLRKKISETIIFGHWAALGTLRPTPDVYALDTGCVWGNALTALRLQDKQLFSVRAQA